MGCISTILKLIFAAAKRIWEKGKSLDSIIASIVRSMLSNLQQSTTPPRPDNDDWRTSNYSDGLTEDLLKQKRENQGKVEELRKERKIIMEKVDKNRIETQKQSEEYLVIIRAVRTSKKEIWLNILEECEKARIENQQKMLQILESFHEMLMMEAHWKRQEIHWDDYLERLRGPVIIFKHRFLRLSVAPFEMFDKKKLSKQLFNFQKLALHAYFNFYDSFDPLFKLSEDFPNKIFMKIILVKISSCGNSFAQLIEAINGFENNEESFFFIQEIERSIKINEIPTARQLYKLSENAKLEDFKNIRKPRDLNLSRPVISET